MSNTLTKKEMKLKAQDLLMSHISAIGYGDDWDDFKKFCGNDDTVYEIMKKQMDRIAAMFGYHAAWFS